jgi:hypothetical protein
MEWDPGDIVICKHCMNAWFVKENEIFNKIMNRREEEVKKYFLCRECGHEVKVIVERGNDFTEMDYDRYLIFSLTKAV